jgi:hypothetical protein
MQRIFLWVVIFISGRTIIDCCIKERGVSKINERPENRINDYLAPSGIRIKRACIKSMIQALFIQLNMSEKEAHVRIPAVKYTVSHAGT